MHRQTEPPAEDPLAPVIEAVAVNLFLAEPSAADLLAGRWSEVGNTLELRFLLDTLLTPPSRRARTRKTGRRALEDLEDLFPARPAEHEGRLAQLREALRARGGPCSPLPRPGRPVDRALDVIAGVCSLNAVEREVLLLSLAIASDEGLRGCLQGRVKVGWRGGTKPEAAAMAAALGRAMPEVLPALGPGGALHRSGLIAADGRYALLEAELDDRLVEAAYDPELTAERFQAAFLPHAPAPTLSLADFPSLRTELERVALLLRAAMRAGQAGVNVVFWGPTGTGKTEAAALVARAGGALLFSAGAARADGSAPSAAQRLASLVLGNRILDPAASLLLFDEFDDAIGEAPLARGLRRLRAFDFEPPSPKQWINRQLETNRVPTLWTLNDIQAVDPAFRRRFTYAVEFKALGSAQRRQVLSRHLSSKSRIAAAELDEVARRFPLSPAQLSGAVRSAQLVASGEGERAEDLEAALAQRMRISTGRGPLPRERPEAFLLEAVNAPLDLPLLVERLAQAGKAPRPGLKVCLHGPPGTGKTELARHLARRMGRRVVARRAAEVQGALVGETEKNLAEAFEEAEREEALLLFDEADSFLRDRRLALRSWEVTAVNEFLQQLEAFAGVVVCTTNLFETLDRASMRRFAFKIQILDPTPRQLALLAASLLAESLGARALDPAELETALAGLRGLTQGDLAAVARRMQVLGSIPTLPDLVSELREELSAREGLARAAGFTPPARSAAAAPEPVRRASRVH